MSDAHRILLIEPDPAVADFLAKLMRQAGHTVLTAPSGKEGLIEAWRNRPDLIIIDGELKDLTGLEIIRKLRADARTSQAQLWLLATNAAPGAALTARQAGADEYLVKRAGVDTDLLMRLKVLPPPPPPPVTAPLPPPPAGQVIAFLSAKGGTGTSSLCANMAQNLAALVKPRTVAVVDLVLPIGSIDQIVGVDAGPNLVDLSKLEPAQLTPASLRQHIAACGEWGFQLLRGSPDPEAAQALNVGRLEAIFSLLRRSYDFIVVDFGRAVSRISLPILREAARIVLILSPDYAAVALTKTTLKYLELQNIRRNFIYPILNRAVGLEGLNKSEIEMELGLNIAGVVPHMSGALAQANNAHRPIALKYPDDSATFNLQALTKTLLIQAETKSTRPLVP